MDLNDFQSLKIVEPNDNKWWKKIFDIVNNK